MISWPALVVAARYSSTAFAAVEAADPAQLRRLRGVAAGYRSSDPTGEAREALWLVSGRPDELVAYTFHRARQRLGIEARRRRAADDRRRSLERIATADRSVPAGWGNDPASGDDGSGLAELLGLLPLELRPVARLIASGSTVGHACRRVGVSERTWYKAVAAIRAAHCGEVA